MRQVPSPLMQQPLRIVHLTTFYPPWGFGGDAVHVQRLAEAQARRGHQVSVVCAPAAFRLLRGAAGRGLALPDSSSGVTVHALDGATAAIEPLLVHQTGSAVLQRSELRRYLGAAARVPPDVVHYHNISLIGGLAGLRLGAGVKLLTAHEYWLLCPTHLLFRYGREVCTRRTCMRCTLHARRPPQLWRYLGTPDRALRELDSVIYPSALTASVYRDHGVDRPATVLPHFLPDALLASARARGDRDPAAPPYFLYVGRLDAVKGIEALLRVCSERGLPLRVAGDGPLAGPLRSGYASADSIEFLGQLDESALGRLYRDAIALILPSAGLEVFGQVVLEAFAHATPALVTPVGGARELVEASRAGFVYGSDEELGDLMQRLAGDAAERASLARRAAAYVRQHHREGDYIERYEELVGSRGRP